jgi:hypothetical protein
MRLGLTGELICLGIVHVATEIKREFHCSLSFALMNGFESQSPPDRAVWDSTKPISSTSACDIEIATECNASDLPKVLICSEDHYKTVQNTAATIE